MPYQVYFVTVIWSTNFEMNLVFSSSPDFHLRSWHLKLGPRGSLQRKNNEYEPEQSLVIAVSIFVQLIIAHNVNENRLTLTARTVSVGQQAAISS